MLTYSRPASMITRSNTRFQTTNAHTTHSQAASRGRFRFTAHRRRAYARSPTLTIATAATIDVTRGGVPLGDDRANTAATIARTTSAANVTMRPRPERGRALDGGRTSGSVVAAPHL